MKFDSIQLIYLHPARTGGTQIENIICRNLGIVKGDVSQPDQTIMFGYHSSQYGNLQHSTLAEIEKLSGLNLNPYSVVCSIRNPISKFVSAYYYNGCVKAFSRPLELLLRLSERPIEHFLPQTLYTHQNDIPRYSSLIRNENYREDLKLFCDRLGFQFEIQERYNTCCKSAYDHFKNRNEIDLFHAFFTKEERRIFYRLYKTDLLLLYRDYLEIVENML